MIHIKNRIKLSLVTACLITSVSIANTQDAKTQEEQTQKPIEISVTIDETKGITPTAGKDTNQVGIATSFVPSPKSRKIFTEELDGDVEKYTKVSLFDAVLEAVANSHNVKAAREKVRQAQLNLDDAYSGYKPTLDAEYRLGRTHKTPGDEDEDDPTKKYTDETLKVQLKQNIYSGGATVNKIRGLEKSLEVAQNRYELALNQEIQNGIKAYFGVVFSSNALSVTKANMEMLNKILEIVTIKYDLGAASIGDLSSIKASVANAESKFSRTKSKFVESIKYYEYIVGENFKYTLPYEYEFDIEVEPLEHLIELAYSQNLNISSFLINIEAERFKLKSSESAFRPQVDLELSSTRTYNKDKDPEEFYKQNTNQAFVTVKYNLYNGGKDANKMKSIYSTIRELNYKVSEEKRKVKWIISNIHQSLQALSSSISSTKQEVESSKVMVDSYWEAFKNGEQDLTTLLGGQRQLNTAEVSLLEFYENRLNDYFKLLLETGRLINYFGLSPKDDKFIDFSQSGYNNQYFEPVIKDNIAMAKAEVSARADGEATIIEQVDSLADILVFKDKFLDATDDKSTIFISDFETIYDAFGYMKENDLSKQVFIVDVLDDYKLRSVMAYGIFDDEQSAIDTLAQLKQLPSKQYKIVSIGEIKELYRKFITGFDELRPKAIVQTKTIKMAPKPPQEYVTNARFKQEFINASEDYYTINLVTFANLDDAINLIETEDLYDSSLIFRYGQNGEWIKIVHGVFSKYEDAHIALSFLSSSTKEKYYPVVEHIKHQQDLYSKYKDLKLGAPTKARGDVEYIEISTDIQTQTKEIIFDKENNKTILVDIDDNTQTQTLDIDFDSSLNATKKLEVEKEVLDNLQNKVIEEKNENSVEVSIQEEVVVADELEIVDNTKEIESVKETQIVPQQEVVEEVVEIKELETKEIEAEVLEVPEVKVDDTIKVEKIELLEEDKLSSIQEEVVVADELEIVDSTKEIESVKETQIVPQQEVVEEVVEIKELETKEIEAEVLEVPEVKVDDTIKVEEIEEIEVIDEVQSFEEPIVIKENDLSIDLPKAQDIQDKIVDISQNTQDIQEVYFEPQKTIEDLSQEQKVPVEGTFQVDINIIKKSQLQWFVDRYKISNYKTQDLQGGNVRIYLGEFDNKVLAQEAMDSLHPYINSISKIIEINAVQE